MIEKLLKRTINNINDTIVVDWNSTAAKVLKKIYDDYYIDTNKEFVICRYCNKKTYFTFKNKSDLKISKKYCDNCVILFESLL